MKTIKERLEEQEIALWALDHEIQQTGKKLDATISANAVSRGAMPSQQMEFALNANSEQLELFPNEKS